MQVQRNSELLSCNHCCSTKAMSITQPECVCIFSLRYTACNAHARYYIVICGLSSSTNIFHIISKTAWFSEKL